GGGVAGGGGVGVRGSFCARGRAPPTWCRGCRNSKVKPGMPASLIAPHKAIQAETSHNCACPPNRCRRVQPEGSHGLPITGLGERGRRSACDQCRRCSCAGGWYGSAG